MDDEHVLLGRIGFDSPFDEIGQRVGRGVLGIVGAIDVCRVVSLFFKCFCRVNTPANGLAAIQLTGIGIEILLFLQICGRGEFVLHHHIYPLQGFGAGIVEIGYLLQIEFFTVTATVAIVEDGVLWIVRIGRASRIVDVVAGTRSKQRDRTADCCECH